jgi:hypothetical protein
MLEIFMHQVLYILESEVQSLNDFIQTWWNAQMAHNISAYSMEEHSYI